MNASHPALHRMPPTDLLSTSPTREAVTAATRLPEVELMPELLAAARLPDAARSAVHRRAMKLAMGVRAYSAGMGRAGLVQGLLQEFALSSQEGVALMCLAEALLRIPDAATRDALIRDKIGSANWQSHLGHSSSLFVNAASWGLLLTGRLMATHSGSGLESALRRALGRGGEPVVRKALDMGMRLMGEQFVTGQTIGEALKRARPLEAQGFRYSYDMLGEAALTHEDALRYLKAYEDAIQAIGQAAQGDSVIERAGISIKLSALHPRYVRAQLDRVRTELYPRLLRLACMARDHGIGLNIDAEESERLELSLDLLERLCEAPELAGFDGIGFVVQAYQKRCPAVVAHLVSLARRTRHRLMVRLVKGAYWDSEIKRAQVDGLDDYPVYTRKAHTDVAYLACARALLAAPDAIFPQFATHNAHTVSAIVEMADEAAWTPAQYEFQCLHGMGEPLYEQVVGGQAEFSRPCRIYAPVGTHETLLAYLVRRLLENGANTSFVNRVANEAVDLESLVEDPVLTVERMAQQEGVRLGSPHAAIAAPSALPGPGRLNSRGLDLNSEAMLAQWLAYRAATVEQTYTAAPGVPAQGLAAARPVRNPACPSDLVGTVREADAGDVQAALARAETGARAWAEVPASERAACLDRAAAAFEARQWVWLDLLAREAGKTAGNAVAEVREAVDFLRYYAQQLRLQDGLGSTRPLGPVACISPWNFPLAIFTGQVAAALAAGNAVLAKPAEQTPLIAGEAVRLLHESGIPHEALQLLPGEGETVGAALVADTRVQGVVFTGSTEVARAIQRSLAQRLSAHGQPIPLIAETGGQNAMIVDSSALLEQVAADVITSAFDSAGQRCSALRVLCVQEEMAEPLLRMVKGAMAELTLGDPRLLATDVGPVIDAAARAGILAHIERLRSAGCTVHQCPSHLDAAAEGTFVPPTLIELASLEQLHREVFGPVLHVVRWKRQDLALLMDQLRATGYGLTMGLHTRIDETIAQVVASAHVGNLYVNRNMVGAVVGVQPFGGEGLSGTGPKAGGPLYLLRLLAQRPADAPRRLLQAAGVAVESPVRGLADRGSDAAQAPARALVETLRAQGRLPLALAAQSCVDRACTHDWRLLPGPTGERNVYAACPREAVLCLSPTEASLWGQTAAVLAQGGRAVWPAQWQALHDRLPESLRGAIATVRDWAAPGLSFDAVLFEGEDAELLELQGHWADQEGPIVPIVRTYPLEDGRDLPLERLVLERSVSVNTAAAGGNASLMTIG